MSKKSRTFAKQEGYLKRLQSKTPKETRITEEELEKDPDLDKKEQAWD